MIGLIRVDSLSPRRHKSTSSQLKAFSAFRRIAATFAEPGVGRQSLMAAAFGPKVAGAGIFAREEMPHGATLLDDAVYFVLHAPHSASVDLVLVDETHHPPVRQKALPMQLTPDDRYWWCSVPAKFARKRDKIPICA